MAMNSRRTPLERVEYVLIVSTLLLLVVFTLQPLLNLLALSFTEPSKVAGFSGLSIFPEGTTSDGCEMLPFKSGLLSALEGLPKGVPVQPVALVYDEPGDIAWVGAEPGLRNAATILSRTRPIHLTLRFLPPLSGAALADRKTMAAAARAAIERALN